MRRAADVCRGAEMPSRLPETRFFSGDSVVLFFGFGRDFDHSIQEEH